MSDRILVVDDTPINVTLLARILDREGYDVLTADNGRDALRLVREERPDLVLLDVVMPILDGYAVCGALKRDAATRDIPVIFISALRDACDKVKARRLGAVDTLAKPFNEGEVLARVAAHLELRRLRGELETLRHGSESRARRAEAELARIDAALPGLLPAVPRESPALAWSGPVNGDARGGSRILGATTLDPDHAAAFAVIAGGGGPGARLLAARCAQDLLPPGPLVSGVDPAPGEVLTRLGERHPIERHGRILSVAWLLLHRPTGMLRYALAGLPAPRILRAGGTVESLEGGGTPLGLGALEGATRACEEGTVVVHPGDRLELLVTTPSDRGGAPLGRLEVRAPAALDPTRFPDWARRLPNREARRAA